MEKHRVHGEFSCAFLVHSLLIELPLDIGYSFHYMNTIPLIVEI